MATLLFASASLLYFAFTPQPSFLLIDSLPWSRLLLLNGSYVNMAEKVVFDSGHFSNFAPLRQPPTIKRRNKKQDFGNLKNLKLFAQDGLARSIYRELSEERGLSQDEEESKSEKDEWFEHIYAFDDDYLRSTYQGWGDRKIKKERLCRRVSWYRRNPTDCNSVHELDVLGKLVENRLHYLR